MDLQRIQRARKLRRLCLACRPQPLSVNRAAATRSPYKLRRNLSGSNLEMDLQITSDSESKEVEDVMPSLSSPALVCQPGSCHKMPIQTTTEFGALQFGHEKSNTGHAEMCYGNWPSQALGSHQDDRRKERKFVLAENLLRMQTPISGNNTSRSQAQEGSHNSIVPYFNPAQDDSSRILSWLGNNQLTLQEEQHSESETTIQDNYIVDMDSISSGANFQAGTFGGSNSYPPAQVVINVAVPTDSGAQNPTDYQWLKISKILIPVSAGAVYNTSSMFAKAANTLAFIATLTAISLRPTRSRAIRISTKFAAIACAAGTLAAIGHDLPDDYRWASGVAFLIPAVAVAVA